MQFVLMIDVTDTGRFHPYRCVKSLQLCKCRAGRTWSKQLCSCSIYSWNTVMCSRWLRLKLAVFVCLSHFLKCSIFEILPNFSHTHLKRKERICFLKSKLNIAVALLLVGKCIGKPERDYHYILHKFSLRL